jgi:hypothetical protein
MIKNEKVQNLRFFVSTKIMRILAFLQPLSQLQEQQEPLPWIKEILYVLADQSLALLPNASGFQCHTNSLKVPFPTEYYVGGT